MPTYSISVRNYTRQAYITQDLIAISMQEVIHVQAKFNAIW